MCFSQNLLTPLDAPAFANPATSTHLAYFSFSKKSVLLNSLLELDIFRFSGKGTFCSCEVSASALSLLSYQEELREHQEELHHEDLQKDLSHHEDLQQKQRGLLDLSDEVCPQLCSD